MSALVADRVIETTAVVGVGTMTLLGAASGYQSFGDAFATGSVVKYCVTDGTDWEIGEGTYTAAGATLSRDTIEASSNSGAAVNWSSGTKDVFCTPTATMLQSLDNILILKTLGL